MLLKQNVQLENSRRRWADFQPYRCHMIAYDLQCAKGHSFEGWFEDGKSYESQMKKGLVSCPVCDGKQIVKIPSTFSIKSSPVMPAIPPQQLEATKLGHKIATFVKENFDDVGCNFATEALKIHYGVSEPRNIRGVSTKDEEKTLEKEGVQFYKIPLPENSDSDNKKEET